MQKFEGPQLVYKQILLYFLKECFPIDQACHTSVTGNNVSHDSLVSIQMRNIKHVGLV